MMNIEERDVLYNASQLLFVNQHLFKDMNLVTRVS